MSIASRAARSGLGSATVAVQNAPGTGDSANGIEAWGTVEVDYERDPKLDMWVPVQMHETYMEMRGSLTDRQHRWGGDVFQFPPVRDLGPGARAVIAAWENQRAARGAC